MVAGNLNIDEGCRRLVPADIWYRFKSYFPDAPEFTGLAEVCHECYVRANVPRWTNENDCRSCCYHVTPVCSPQFNE